MTRSRRPGASGFTLVEVVVAAVLLLPLAIGAASLALSALRQLTRAGAVSEEEAALDTAAQILEAELAALTPGDGVLDLAPDRIRIRAVRTAGRWCQYLPVGVVVPATPARWAAARLPVPGRDSVALDLADSTALSGIRRTRYPVAAPPSAMNCSPGVPGLLVETGPLPPAPRPEELFVTEEVVELAGYVSGSHTWLGIRHLGLGTPIEPVAGPFAPGGVRFIGLGALGTPTGVAALITAVVVELVPEAAGAAPRTLRIPLRG